MRPLYCEVKDAEIDWQEGNTGLWYDKFFDQWDKDFAEIPPEGKKRWIEGVTKTPCGDEAQLAQALTRLTGLLEAHGQSPLYYKLESDFVTGLGREHPVENGFAWHHTLGTPYLPGSSVKGMVRAWAEQWHKWVGKKESELSAEDKAEFETYKQDVRCVFGDTNEVGAGSVIFLDALPTGPTQFKADIMTPHYGPYYQDESGQTPPADWHNPTPIPFLVVEKGQSFVFGVLPRRMQKQNLDDCEQARTWLGEALEWTGAGAKTAVGYGRFAVDKEAQKRAEEAEHQRLIEQQEKEAEEARQRELEQQTKGKSKLYAALYATSLSENWRGDKNIFSRAGLIEGWLDELEANPQEDATKYLAALIEYHFSDLLKNPDAMRGKKNDKPKFKDRQRTFAKRLIKLLEGA